MADQVPSVPTGLKAKVDDGLQATELVIRRNCLAGAELSQDFAMHVPLKENGEPNFKKQYYTGSIKILPKATATSKSCLEYNVLRRGK